MRSAQPLVCLRYAGFALALALFVLSPTSAAEKSGATLYRQQCVDCHGRNGEGVPDEAEEPLRGRKSLGELTQLIHKTMPDEDPKLCQDEDAKLVAQYIYDSFYTLSDSAASRIDLSRLTVTQYLNSSADLLKKSSPWIGQKRGLTGKYYESRNRDESKRKLTRVDKTIDFDFGEGTPDEKVKKREEFSMRWDGSLLAEDTGEYEIILRSQNGARLWLNNRDDALIDAYVSTSEEPQEQRVTVRLLGGRTYPLSLEMFKYKEKTASIRLEWKPPFKARQVIPERNLLPDGATTTYVANAKFPADDAVSGYVRGASISKAWDEATTDGALEMATYVADHLDELAKISGDAKNRRELVKQLCYQLAQRAFRRPLTDEQRRFFVDSQFVDGRETSAAVKRSMLLILKSPRFLYPNVEKLDDGNTLATRLALLLWDSLPDQPLLNNAEQLDKPGRVATQAQRMLRDPRAKAKVRQFFQHWLQLNEKEEIYKDKKLFPQFSEQVAADLRTSLEVFVDDIVWSERSDFRQLLLADYVYMNPRLAKFYGVKAPENGGFTKVSFEKPHRAGVVSHPYMLSMFAYHNLSSPVHRGVFTTRHLLGRTLKPPPQAIEFKAGDFAPELTTREKLTELTKPSACMTCHVVINPLGYSLENFDAVGRYRDKEGDRKVNTTSDYLTVDGDTVELKGARSLAQFLATSRQAQGTFVDQLFHHMVKQPINAYGEDVRDQLIDKFIASEFNIQKLLVEIVQVAVLHGHKESKGKS